MKYEIKNVEQLEKLINNRIYVDNLEIPVKFNINNHVKFLTNLTQLCFWYYYNYGIDLSMLSNLTCLVMFSNMNNINISKLTNLKHLDFESKYENEFTLLTNLTYLNLHDNYNTNQIDFLKLSNLTWLNVGYKYDHPMDLSNLSNLSEICIPDSYKHIIDFSKCENIKTLRFTFNGNSCSISIDDDEKLEIVDISKFDLDYPDLVEIKKLLVVKKK